MTRSDNAEKAPGGAWNNSERSAAAVVSDDDHSSDESSEVPSTSDEDMDSDRVGVLAGLEAASLPDPSR